MGRRFFGQVRLGWWGVVAPFLISRLVSFNHNTSQHISALLLHRSPFLRPSPPRPSVLLCSFLSSFPFTFTFTSSIYQTFSSWVFFLSFLPPLFFYVCLLACSGEGADRRSGSGGGGRCWQSERGSGDAEAEVEGEGRGYERKGGKAAYADMYDKTRSD